MTSRTAARHRGTPSTTAGRPGAPARSCASPSRRDPEELSGHLADDHGQHHGDRYGGPGEEPGQPGHGQRRLSHAHRDVHAGQARHDRSEGGGAGGAGRAPPPPPPPPPPRAGGGGTGGEEPGGGGPS